MKKIQIIIDSDGHWDVSVDNRYSGGYADASLTYDEVLLVIEKLQELKNDMEAGQIED